MPDLLAHALLAYSLGTLLSLRYAWLTPQYVTVVMAGAFVPDLTKIRLLVPSGQVQELLGIPFDWAALHTGGAAMVAVLVGSMVVPPAQRRRVTALLTLGAASHLTADALLLTSTGRSYAVFWPLTQYHPPTPGLYLSTSPIPTVLAAALAAVVWYAVRYRAQ
jgi:pimeloyl-ACP methyl ester carboxylesterase